MLTEMNGFIKYSLGFTQHEHIRILGIGVTLFVRRLRGTILSWRLV